MPTSRAPIIRGIMKLKNVAPNGIITMKIMVVPCMVNMALNHSAEMREASEVVSCKRINPASIPPTRKKIKAETPYRAPIRLWSTVVSQLHRPV